jgi:hypothetical protein
MFVSVQAEFLHLSSGLRIKKKYNKYRDSGYSYVVGGTVTN